MARSGYSANDGTALAVMSSVAAATRNMCIMALPTRLLLQPGPCVREHLLGSALDDTRAGKFPGGGGRFLAIDRRGLAQHRQVERRGRQPLSQHDIHDLLLV